jgi:hypothetical protein
MVSKKMKAKGRAIVRAKSAIHPPNFNVMDYQLSMLQSLNYYNEIDDNKLKRSWAYGYWKTQNHDVKKLDSLSDAWFHTVGAVAHMVSMDVPIHESDLIKLDSAYTQLLSMVEQEKVEIQTQPDKTEPKKSIQDYMNDAASLHIGEIEGALDSLITKGPSFDVKSYLIGCQVKAPVAKRIGDWFKTKLSEYNSIGDDKELLDAYGGKRLVTKIVSFLETVVNDCNTLAQIARTTKAPRKRKEQPPSKLVANMKWMREYIDLAMKSVFPEKIVHSSEAWLYDTAKRRLIRYVSQDGYDLSVKGTRIMNFDPEKSGSKIVRKPEILNGYTKLTKRPFAELYNGINSMVAKCNGRTNENIVILAVF